MFSFFRKTERKESNEAQEKKEETPFNIFGDKTPKLTEWDKERYYRLSVRRTVNDFIDQTGHSMDEDITTYQSAFNNVDKAGEDIIYSHFASQCFIGYNACALLKQNWLINNACTVPAEDAIAPGFKFVMRDKEEEEGEIDLEEIEFISDRDYKISDIAKRLEVNKKVFGVALAIPTFRGKYDYSNPFNIDNVKKNSYTGWAIIEPYWVTPELDEESARNPASKRFFKPTWWRLSDGERVHYTQCIALINSEVPDTLKPTYYFGGIPLTQLLYQRVYASEKVANEAPMLAMTKRLLVMDANLANYVGQQGEAEKALNTFSWCRDNFGVAIKNHGDQMTQLDTTLTDFDSLIMTQVQLVASIAQIPATKLLKTTPKGFNATGEYEQKDYVQSLLSIQNNDMKPLIDRHFMLLAKSKFGRVINGECKFNPIDTPSGSEQAQINSTNAQTLSNLVSSGIISPEEARENLQKQETAEFSTLDTEQIPNEGESGGEEEFLKQLMAKKKQENDGVATDEAEFIESEHPRDKEGKFTNKGGGAGGDLKKKVIRAAENQKIRYHTEQGSKEYKEYFKTMTKSYSPLQKEAIEAYTTAALFNTYLAENKKGNKYYDERIQALKLLTHRPMEYDQELYRLAWASDIPELNNFVFQNFGKEAASNLFQEKISDVTSDWQKLVGQKISFPIFLSTSANDKWGNTDDSNEENIFKERSILFKINAPAGTLGADVGELSVYKKQDEVILPPNTTFQITKVEESKNENGETTRLIVSVDAISPQLTDEEKEEVKTDEFNNLTKGARGTTQDKGELERKHKEIMEKIEKGGAVNFRLLKQKKVIEAKIWLLNKKGKENRK